jgi:hypothetical protein
MGFKTAIFYPVAALRSDSKCSRTAVYAPLENRIGALPSSKTWDFKTNSGYFFKVISDHKAI